MTAEQLHDALGMLSSDLIAETDALRTRPRTPVIQWHRWAAMAACLVLVLGCGFAVMRSGLLASGGNTEKFALQQDMAAAECAPEAPAAAAPTEAAGELTDNSLSREEPAEDSCDCAPSITEEEAPTYGTPPVDIDSAEFFFGELSIHDEVHLIKTVAELDALDLGIDVYDEGWFGDFDLLLIALPGITSPDRLDISMEQGADPHHWEIRLGDDLLERADCADSLLICIPVHKGHIPEDAEFALLYE